MVWWIDDVLTPAEHVAEGDAQLLWQYADKPRERAWLAEQLGQVESLEAVGWQLLCERSIYTALGEQLDTIGRIVDQPRGGMLDEEYRLFLLGRIFVNRSNGTLPEFLELLQLLGVEDVAICEYPPAAIQVTASEVAYPWAVGELLFDMKPAGVRLMWVRSIYPAAELFTLSSTPGTDEVDANRGLADISGSPGGMFVDMRWMP